MDGIVGVVLAAGRGTRLRPLTRLRPKALCPVGNVPLVDLALERVRPAVERGGREPAPRPPHARPAPRRRRAPLDRGRAAARHRRRARPPAAVDRRSRHAGRQRRRLVPRLAGAASSTAGTASGSGCCSPAATSCGPTARIAGALMPWSDVAGARARAVGAVRGVVAAAAQDGPARGRAPRRPVRRLRHAAAVPGRQPAGQRRRERGGARRAWSRASSTGAWCGATPRVHAGEALSCCIRARGAAHRARAVTLPRLASCGGAELAAGGVDLGAAGAADGGVHAAGPRARRGTRAPARPASRAPRSPAWG